MNRLITGAENSLSASSEMFSKSNSNQTGDLAISVMNRGGGLLMGRSRGDFIRPGLRDETDQDEDMDFSKMQGNTIMQESISDSKLKASNASPIVRYSHIKTALVNSLADLDNQIRQMEFRNIFRLSYTETITSQESPCYYFIKAEGGVTHQGDIYLSQNFINFCSLGPISAASQTNTTSMLFETSQDPALIFTIPYSHIVSIQKQSPTSLAAMGKLFSMSLSGYLVISTKNRYEFWLSFSSLKARDRLYDLLLSRIKTVDWNFDDDVIIGGRNGPLNNAEKTKTPMARRMSMLDGSNSAINLILDTHRVESKVEILRTGLGFLIPSKEKDGSAPLFLSNDKGVVRWAEYFDAYGKDVCIVKSMIRLRELIVQTNGVPVLYRGDFWMLVSGAWNSRPEKGYYESLLSENKQRINPFGEEIEKDVRRYTVKLIIGACLNIQHFKVLLGLTH